jgi:hypothetical protein
MTDFRSRDQPRKPKKFIPQIFFQGFTCRKPFVAILSSSPSRNHNGATEKSDLTSLWKRALFIHQSLENYQFYKVQIEILTCTIVKLFKILKKVSDHK